MIKYWKTNETINFKLFYFGLFFQNNYNLGTVIVIVVVYGEHQHACKMLIRIGL